MKSNQKCFICPTIGKEMDSSTYIQPSFVQPQILTHSSFRMKPLLPETNILIVGGCPQCRIGLLTESFSKRGLLCAFTFFPIGLIYLFTSMEKKCANCDFTEG
uniref:Membrane protein BRI3 n=1 Tax=Caligus clemensi TaxID=344056 RepID=C1C2P5_CALCM|nr:Brain protein I3 [Caligus clemensi]